MKQYCAYAYKKDDPSDILGFVESEYPNCYQYSKERVLLVKAFDKQRYSKMNFVPLKQKVKKIYCENKRILPIHKVATKNQVKNRLLHRDFYVYGDNPNLYTYRIMKRLTQEFPPPQGYQVVVVRYNSKYCKINIDTSYRNKKDAER